MPILGIIASSFRSAAGPQGAYDALATVTLSTSTSSITFAGIPSGYKHLQVRALARNTSNSITAYITFNSDTGANYTLHRLVGTGSGASAGGFTGQNSFIMSYFVASSSYTSGVFGAGIIDILDYTNTNKYKTIRALNGVDNNGSGSLALNSSLWLNTSAINSLTITSDGTSFAQYSSFALYGVK